MPLHNWSRVDAGTFHGFHTAWITHLSEALNQGRLPEGYYALPEQHGTRFIADVLTLHAGPGNAEEFPRPTKGGLALSEAPPKVQQKRTAAATARSRQRTLAIRHVTGHRIVAMVEIVSPANKDRPRHVEALVSKVTTALGQGIHVTLGDVFAPGPHDPVGIDGAIWQALDDSEGPCTFPPGLPLTFASYVAGFPEEAYVEHLTFGHPLPEMPLFLSADYYVNLPLESTYEAAFGGMPKIWRDVLEAPDQPRS